MRLALYLLLAAAYYLTLLARADRQEWMPLPTEFERALQWFPLLLLITLVLLEGLTRRDDPHRWLLWPAVLMAMAMLCYTMVLMVQ